MGGIGVAYRDKSAAYILLQGVGENIISEVLTDIGILYIGI